MKNLTFSLGFFLCLWCNHTTAHAEGLNPEEIKDYRTYLRDSLVDLDHKDLKISLDKAKEEIFAKLQDLYPAADVSQLLEMMQKDWLMIISECTADSESLLVALLSDTNIELRPEKFTLLVENGLFYIDSNVELNWSYNNLNYRYFYDYLIHHDKQKDTDVLAFLISFLNFSHLSTAFTLSSSEQEFKRTWIEKNYLAILKSLLKNSHFEAAAFLIEELPSFGIPYLQHFEDTDLDISIRCYAPVMEAILSIMETLYQRQYKLGSQELEEKLEGVHIFDALSGDFLDSKPFEPDSILRFEKAINAYKIRLDSELVNAYKNYISLGQLRNHFFGIYSRFLQLELASSQQPKRFFYELIAYLHSENPSFQHVFSFNGFEYLFLNRGGNGENFLTIALNWFDIYMFSILIHNIPLTSLDDDNSNFFHHLLTTVDSFSTQNSLVEEERCLRLVHFILFTYQIESKLIIKYLRQKNENGETPLYIAAKKGMFRVFMALRKYLNNHSFYSEDEHAPPYFLDHVLLNGIEQRTQTVENSELTDLHAKLREKIDSRNQQNSCLTYFSQANSADYRHQKIIFNRIQAALSLPIPPKKDPNKHLYPTLFSKLIDHYFAVNFWTGSFKDFAKAPASIQMSYLREPIKLIVNKIIFNHARGRVDAKQIMSILCGKHQNRISNVLKELIMVYITELMNQDTRKVGQW